jgi:hypothetical protein
MKPMVCEICGEEAAGLVTRGLRQDPLGFCVRHREEVVKRAKGTPPVEVPLRITVSAVMLCEIATAATKEGWTMDEWIRAALAEQLEGSA